MLYMQRTNASYVWPCAIQQWTSYLANQTRFTQSPSIELQNIMLYIIFFHLPCESTLSTIVTKQYGVAQRSILDFLFFVDDNDDDDADHTVAARRLCD